MRGGADLVLEPWRLIECESRQVGHFIGPYLLASVKFNKNCLELTIFGRIEVSDIRSSNPIFHKCHPIFPAFDTLVALFDSSAINHVIDA